MPFKSDSIWRKLGGYWGLVPDKDIASGYFDGAIELAANAQMKAIETRKSGSLFKVPVNSRHIHEFIELGVNNRGTSDKNNYDVYYTVDNTIVSIPKMRSTIASEGSDLYQGLAYIITPGKIYFKQDPGFGYYYAPVVYKNLEFIKNNYGSYVNVYGDNTELYKRKVQAIFSSLWRGATIGSIKTGVAAYTNAPIGYGKIKDIKTAIDGSKIVTFSHHGDTVDIYVPDYLNVVYKKGEEFDRVVSITDGVDCYDYYNNPQLLIGTIDSHQRYETFIPVVEARILSDYQRNLEDTDYEVFHDKSYTGTASISSDLFIDANATFVTSNIGNRIVGSIIRFDEPQGYGGGLVDRIAVVEVVSETTVRTALAADATGSDIAYDIRTNYGLYDYSELRTFLDRIKNARTNYVIATRAEAQEDIQIYLNVPGFNYYVTAFTTVNNAYINWTNIPAFAKLNGLATANSQVDVVASVTFVDGSADFIAAGIQVGDILKFITEEDELVIGGSNASVNTGSFFVVNVVNSTTLELDIAPVAETAVEYIMVKYVDTLDVAEYKLGSDTLALIDDIYIETPEFFMANKTQDTNYVNYFALPNFAAVNGFTETDYNNNPDNYPALNEDADNVSIVDNLIITDIPL
jgi:hypothetical protein